MRTLITGKVVDFVPTFGAHLDGGCLVLSEDGGFTITVDTGFGRWNRYSAGNDGQDGYGIFRI